jgi:Zn-finger nucleic acid-binding protein
MVANLDEGPAASKPASVGNQAVRYRPCPVCKALMNRSQYGKYSRVIVDTCKQHGVWLDEGELSQILEWVRGGGLDQSRKAVHEARVQELRNQQFAATMASQREAYQSGGSDEGSSGASLFMRLFF